MGGIKQKVLVALLLGVFCPALWAIECAPGDIFLTRQLDIDHFQADYGPCNEVVAGLDIQGADISNLDGLSAVTRVGGDLFITETFVLPNLDGLRSLTAVGGHFGLFHDFALLNVDGLSSLGFVGKNFGIYANPELVDIDGLASLTRVDGFMGVTDLHSLTNIDGLGSLTQLGGSLVFNVNAELTDLDGLIALEAVGGGIIVKNSPKLVSVDGLGSIKSVRYALHIEGNQSLALCAGLRVLMDTVDDAEPGPGSGLVPDVGGWILLGGNVPGCNSVRQILHGVALQTPLHGVPMLGQWALYLLVGFVLVVGLRASRGGPRSYS